MRRPVRTDCLHHHALCSQRVSCTLCQTARRFKDLARRFLRSRVSGCALARGFLVSAPPVSASWKPFPGGRRKQRPVRERRRPVRKHLARVCADRRRGLERDFSALTQPEDVHSKAQPRRVSSLSDAGSRLACALRDYSLVAQAHWHAPPRWVSSSQHRPSPPPGNRFPAQKAETGSRASETGSQTFSACACEQNAESRLELDQWASFAAAAFPWRSLTETTSLRRRVRRTGTVGDGVNIVRRALLRQSI